MYVNQIVLFEKGFAGLTYLWKKFDVACNIGTENILIQGVVFVKGHKAAIGQDFHFNAEKTDKVIHAAHTAAQVKFFALFPPVQVRGGMENAFNFQKEAVSAVTLQQKLEGFGADSGAARFWGDGEIVKKRKSVFSGQDGFPKDGGG